MYIDLKLSSKQIRLALLIILFVLITSYMPCIAKDSSVNLRELEVEDDIAVESILVEDLQQIDQLENSDDFVVNEEVEVPISELKGGITAVQKSDDDRFKSLKVFLKGTKAQDSIMGGMWSKHFSSNDYREVNNLGAIQLNGLFFGTFANSHSDQTFAVALARSVYNKQLSKDVNFDAGYKIGPMYGYDEGVPNLGGFSILPVINLGLSYKGVGASLNIFPANAVSFHTFVNIGSLSKKKYSDD